MRLSKLQKYILEKCYYNKNGIETKVNFCSFYPKIELEKNKKFIYDTIHKSLENLVEKDLMIAYGRKTARKWFINKVKLTKQGKHQAWEIIKSKQRKLPIK
jgi:hypothetical protein